jgi:hypothetical protein
MRAQEVQTMTATAPQTPAAAGTSIKCGDRIISINEFAWMLTEARRVASKQQNQI